MRTKTTTGIEVDVYRVNLMNSYTKKVVTFPLKGNIIRKGKRPQGCIWTLQGRASVFGESDTDIEITSEIRLAIEAAIQELVTGGDE